MGVAPPTENTDEHMGPPVTEIVGKKYSPLTPTPNNLGRVPGGCSSSPVSDPVHDPGRGRRWRSFRRSDSGLDHWTLSQIDRQDGGRYTPATSAPATTEGSLPPLDGSSPSPWSVSSEAEPTGRPSDPPGPRAPRGGTSPETSGNRGPRRGSPGTRGSPAGRRCGGTGSGIKHEQPQCLKRCVPVLNGTGQETQDLN